MQRRLIKMQRLELYLFIEVVASITASMVGMSGRFHSLWSVIYRSCRDPLYRNAYLLALASIFSAASGFMFWLIVAKFFTPEEVGLGSALITASGLITILSLFGFDIALIRFAPLAEKKSELINSCLIVSFLFALVLVAIFVFGVGQLDSTLGSADDDVLLLFFFVLCSSIAPLTVLQTQGIFIGFRKSNYSLWLTALSVARIATIPFLTLLGSTGIFIAYGLTTLLSFILGTVLTFKIVPQRSSTLVNRSILVNIFRYSSGNYAARILENIPVYVLPLLIISILGAELNAYFFIAWQISGVLMMAPSIATSRSLLAEGANESGDIQKNTRKSVKLTMAILIPLLALLILFGRPLLGFFGASYASNSYEVLIAISIGSIPYAFNTLYAGVMRIRCRIMPVILTYGGIAALTLIGSLALMQTLELIGVGLAWIVANVIVFVIIFLSQYLKKRELSYLLIEPNADAD